MLASVSRQKRRGMILMVVVAFLALFTVLGVTFVFYSSSEAEVSRNARQAENGGKFVSVAGGGGVSSGDAAAPDRSRPSTPP